MLRRGFGTAKRGWTARHPARAKPKHPELLNARNAVAAGFRVLNADQTEYANGSDAVTLRL